MTTAATRRWLDSSFRVAPAGDGVGLIVVLGGSRRRADRANLDPARGFKTTPMGPLPGQISGPILGPFRGPNLGPQNGALLINLIQTLRCAGSFWSREMDPKSAPESNPKRPNFNVELSPRMAPKLARSARSGACAAPSKRYGMKPVRGHWPDKDMGSFPGKRLLGSRKKESLRKK